MPGYGIVRFNTDQRTITSECWPRFVDPTARNAQQYAGWPKTFTQREQYGRAAKAYLPTIVVAGAHEPVVQVKHAQGEVLYTIKMSGNRFQPWTFAPGKYEVSVTPSDTGAVQRRVLDALADPDGRVVEIEFGERK